MSHIHYAGSKRIKDMPAFFVAYLLNLSQDLIDLAIEIHDRQIMILQSKGRKTQEEMQKLRGKSVNEKVIHFADIGSALIKAKVFLPKISNPSLLNFVDQIGFELVYTSEKYKETSDGKKE